MIELSDLLSEHPDIAEVIVVGAPDPRLGERAVAVVVPRPGCEPELSPLCEFLRDRRSGRVAPRGTARHG